MSRPVLWVHDASRFVRPPPLPLQACGVLGAALLALVACSDAVVEPPPNTIGPAGGRLVLADGRVTLTIPPGALTDTVTVSAQSIASAPRAPTLVPGTTYELQPAGLTFVHPAELRIAFDAGNVPSGVRTAELRLFEASGSRWTALSDSGAGSDGDLVVGQIQELGVFAVLGVPVAAITVLPARLQLFPGTTETVTARLEDRDGNVLPDRTVTWASSNPGSANVDADGGVTGYAIGTAKVSARSESAFGSAVVEVCTPCWDADSVAAGPGLLNGVWGASASDVYAVGYRAGGGGLIVHFDGENRAIVPGDSIPALFGVWGRSPTDVYAVGSGIVHFDGATWSRWSKYGTYYGVWVAPTGEAFVVGARLVVERWVDGVRYADTHPLSGTPGWLMDVWGTTASDVYAVGRSDADGVFQSVILHWDGDVWSVVRTADAPFELYGVWGPPGGSSVLTIGRAFDGAYHGIVTRGPSLWTDTEIAISSVHAISGTSAADVVVVGAGSAVRFDGTMWNTLPVPRPGGVNTYYFDAWAAPSGELFLVGAWSASVENPPLMAIARRIGFNE